jgi:hypothetical protein
MGEPDVARVDVALLRAVAGQYEAAGDIVDAVVRNHLLGQTFDGASAGRSHTAAGDALRRAVDEVADQLRQWSGAAAEIAAVLRAAADRYADADVRAAGRLG